MLAAMVLSILQAAAPVEVLPVDAQMAAYEAAFPRLADSDAEFQAHIGRLGPAEAGWSTSGVSVASAIATRQGDPEQYVLGEWAEGGHNVAAPGDRPLRAPSNFRRYSVREHDGPVDFHFYHRLAPGLVLHSFGAVRSAGNAACSRSQGIELISRGRWQDWPEEIAVVAFAVARSWRDNSRTYCIIYGPTRDGGFRQLSYSPEGRPFLLTHEDPEVFTVTTRAEAAARMFAIDSPPPAE